MKFKEFRFSPKNFIKPMKCCWKVKGISIKWLIRSHNWLGSPIQMAISIGIMNAGTLTPAPRRSRWEAGVGRVFMTQKCCQKCRYNGMLRLLRGRCLIWSYLCAKLMKFVTVPHTCFAPERCRWKHYSVVWNKYRHHREQKSRRNVNVEIRRTYPIK